LIFFWYYFVGAGRFIPVNQLERMNGGDNGDNDKSFQKNEKQNTKVCIPVEVEVKDGCSRAAYAASLQMIFRHVADFHMTVVNIISEKYNISVDDIISTVTSHSNYKNMVVDEDLHRFSVAAAPDVKPKPPPSSTIKKTDDGEKKMKIKIKSVPKKVISVDGVEQCD
jgi:hypothetical protein